MRVLTISWDEERDITKITYNQQFSESLWIVRADILKDAIDMLTEKYDAIFTEKGRSGYGKTVDKLRAKGDPENIKYLLDQLNRLTEENAMLKEKAFGQPEPL